MRGALTAVFLLLAGMVLAEPFRVATFNTSLSRRGPGVLLDDIQGGKDRQITTVARIIQTIRPDILLINELDHDYENRALLAFLAVLKHGNGDYHGIEYPYYYAPPQNTGVPSGLDLNGDGKLGGPADAFGYGRFRGQYAMALVSRFPIDTDKAQDFSKLLWRDLNYAYMPIRQDGSPFPSKEAQAVMRLSSKGHWVVPVLLPDGRYLDVMASHPTPPVFDGPENMNGKRNYDEVLFWQAYKSDQPLFRKNLENKGDSQQRRGSPYFVVLGDLNSDPVDGDSSHVVRDWLLNWSELQDPLPQSRGAALAAQMQGGANLRHKGDPALDTSDFRDVPGPGNLRVDYVLPSRSLTVKGAGVFWPAPDEEGFDLIGSDGRASSDHRLVWVDLE